MKIITDHRFYAPTFQAIADILDKDYEIKYDHTDNALGLSLVVIHKKYKAHGFTISTYLGSDPEWTINAYVALPIDTYDIMSTTFKPLGRYDTEYGQFPKLTDEQIIDLKQRINKIAKNTIQNIQDYIKDLNDEFIKYFPTIQLKPILRDTENQRYWIEENLLKVKINEKEFNLAKAILKIIDTYVETKKESFQNFLDACLEIHHLNDSNKLQAYEFIKELIGVSVDARIFEIVSFAILKEKYANESIFIGETLSSVKEESLTLYKTGRTNANDGGIDFVMKPIGRFYQVTETIDVNKYFLDIDKVQKFPITFVIKSDKESNEIKQQIQEQATQKYKVPSIINKYMSCIEEIINVNDLMNIFNNINENGKIQPVINEIIIQSKVEFNYQEEEIEELLEATKENLEINLDLIEEDEE